MLVSFLIQKVKYPVVVIGSEMVGKTSIINRYCNNIFEGTYFATLFSDLHIKRLVRNESDIELHVWDIGGQDQYKVDRKIYLPRAYVVIVVFAVDDIMSFASLGDWMAEIKKYCKENPKLILVANKIDLRAGKPGCVETGQIENEARAAGFDAMIETSAKEGTNVTAVFDLVVEMCKNRPSFTPPAYAAV
jgi:small GTP-binding protein